MKDNERTKVQVANYEPHTAATLPPAASGDWYYADNVKLAQPDDDCCLCDHCAVRLRGECEQWNEPGADVICAAVCSEFEEVRT